MTPQVRDREATEQRIVEAAVDEFTARGFAGARVDEIASKASVNKALLYQYVGDKEHLFKRVLECKLAELGGLQIDPERFAEAAGEFFDFYAANPQLVRLLLWEALDFGTGPVPNEEQRCAMFSERVRTFERAQAAGIIDPSLDPRQVVFTLMSVIVFWFAAPQAARMICGGDPYSPQALAQRRTHIIEIARRILQVRLP